MNKINLYISRSDEVHALILARGGSKGIKYKNLVKIDEITILARTIKTIRNSGCFHHIWVSSDSELIERESIEHGALFHKRPKQYAKDETTSLEAVREFLSTHQTIHKFALFQCTSVFLKESYIKNAFKKFQYSDCVFSVTRSFKLRWKVDGGKLVPLNFDPTSRPRRQDWNGEFVETGMFYFSSKKLVDDQKLQNENCSIVEVKLVDALEIDHYEDLVMARCIKNNNYMLNNN